MKKQILVLFLALLLLCGCSGKAAEPYTLADADTLLNSGAFEGSTMAPIDGAILALLYGVDEDTITECAAYLAVNTSVSADELAVLILTDEAAAIAAEKACRSRIAAQLAVCQSYAPAAVPRLEQALIVRRANTVLLAVGDPEVLSGLKDLH